MPDDNALYNTLYAVVKWTVKSAKEAVMPNISANDLKVKGVVAIEAMLAKQPEAIISVRGKERFVVMDMEQYHYLRECELEAALAQTRTDLAEGRFVKERPEEHLARMKAAP
jgi:hypothetical protein